MSDDRSMMDQRDAVIEADGSVTYVNGPCCDAAVSEALRDERAWMQKWIVENWAWDGWQPLRDAIADRERATPDTDSDDG